MYTSGCPNNQKRCCQRMGSPPPDASKKRVPNWRSKVAMKRAMATMGSENSRRNATIRVIHTNTGIRSSRIPLARMLKMVTMKLTAETKEATPRIWMPSRA